MNEIMIGMKWNETEWNGTEWKEWNGMEWNDTERMNELMEYIG